MNLTNKDRFDFTVGRIKFVIHREADPRWKMDKMISRKYYILAFARSGCAHYETDAGVFHVKQGDVLFFRKGEKRAAASSQQDPWTFISVAFELIPLREDATEEIGAIPTVTSPIDLFSYTNAFDKLMECWDRRDDGSLLQCRGLICDILCRLIRETKPSNVPSPHDAAIEQIKSLIVENYAHTFSVEALAEMSGLSCSHFRALFKKNTGESVLKFQNRLKIAKACDLLKSGACNVTEAAYTVGFSDVYYFSRLFKKITGQSPSHYLKNQR